MVLMNKKLVIATILALSLPVFGQTAAPKPEVKTDKASADSASPAPPEITVKVTPASTKLIEAAKETAENIKNFNKAKELAQNQQIVANKDNQKQIEAMVKDLNDKLKADKKYKPLLDQLDVLNAAQKDSGTKAQAEFSKNVAPIQQKIAQDSALIQGLVPIVREENSLPDTTTFNLETQKWTDSKDKK